MARRALRLLFVLAPALLIGCTTTSRANPFEEGGAAQVIRISVENQQFNDARVTAIRPGGRTTLGTVGGNQRESFRIPWSPNDQLELEVDLLAGGRYTSRPMAVNPGEEIRLFILNPLYRSYIQR